MALRLGARRGAPAPPAPRAGGDEANRHGFGVRDGGLVGDREVVLEGSDIRNTNTQQIHDNHVASVLGQLQNVLVLVLILVLVMVLVLV